MKERTAKAGVSADFYAYLSVSNFNFLFGILTFDLGKQITTLNMSLNF